MTQRHGRPRATTGRLPAVDVERLGRAEAAIDRANSDDPNHLTVGGTARPRALAEGELVAAWVMRLEADHMVEVLVKTLAKMSDRAKQAALEIEFTPRDLALVQRAVAAKSEL